MTTSNNEQEPPKYAEKSTRPGRFLLQKMLKSALILSIFTLIGIGLLLMVKTLTDAPIHTAEENLLQESLNEVMPAEQYDNDLRTDTLQVIAPDYLGTPEKVTIYRARKNHQPVGVILQTIAPDGYSGNIRIMLAVYYDGRIAGVRVLKHKETPGLGDKIDARKSHWIFSFNGLKLRADNKPIWAVRKDGGQFDQFTGATITPRAVIKAVKKALEYVNQQGDTLYE